MRIDSNNSIFWEKLITLPNSQEFKALDIGPLYNIFPGSIYGVGKNDYKPWIYTVIEK